MNWVAKQILRIYIASILIITTPTESMYIYWNVDEKEKKEKKMRKLHRDHIESIAWIEIKEQKRKKKKTSKK